MINFNLFNKRILLYVLSVLIFVFCIFTPVHVSAYTADTSLTGYPFILDGLYLQLNYKDSSGNNKIYYDNDGTLQQQNSYLFNDVDISNIYNIYFTNSNSSYVFPYEPDLYDYYVVGNISAGIDSVFNLDGGNIRIIGNEGLNVTDISYYDFNSHETKGKSFSFKLVSSGNSNVNICGLRFDSPNNTIIKGDLWFSASILPIAKGSAAADVMNSILQKLTEINNNLLQHDVNVGSWISDFKNSVGSLMATLIQKVDAGFTALYNQMTNEQDEKLNGYDGSVASGANTEFQSGAEDLTQIEGQLNTNSTTYVNEFTSTGFDTGILTTLGSSLTFVVTWFTNFWNMGGIWTVGLSTCFAIWIAFYILRTRSK